jgi:NADH-quinone oxidoreductase subunit M
MTWLPVALIVGPLLAAAVWSLRAGDVRAARSASMWGAGGGVVFASLITWFAEESLPAGLRTGILCIFVSLIGLIAVAMSPLRNSSEKSVSRVLVLVAASLAIVLSQHPLVIALLWAFTAYIPWLELRANPETRDTARVFAAYMLPSCTLVAIGAALIQQGMVASAVWPLVVGIALREAIVPLHSWLPVFFEKAPIGLAVAFAAPQIGVYAHLALLGDSLPPFVATIGAALGAVTAVYAGALGVVQTRTRRALGYLLMSQSSLVAFALDAHEEAARIGALVAWMVMGISVAGFAMALGALEARRGTLLLNHPNGSFERVPRLAAAFLVMGLASVGLPGTLGYIAEDLLVQGSVAELPVYAFALIIATGLNGLTVVRNFFCLFTGSSRHEGERDLTRREGSVLTLVLGLLVFLGTNPARFVEALGSSAPHPPSAQKSPYALDDSTASPVHHGSPGGP